MGFQFPLVNLARTMFNLVIFVIIIKIKLAGKINMVNAKSARNVALLS